MTRRAPGAIAIVVALVACAETTVDPSGPTSPPGGGGATTVFAPAGTTTELLATLLEELRGLSERIVANEGDEAALARVDALWAALRPQIEADHLDLLGTFDAAIRLARTSVERRRPADADKAHNNAATLATVLSDRPDRAGSKGQNGGS